MQCIFCRIAAGEVPANFLYQDKEIIAFPDIHPMAPKHILILPREHITSLADLKEKDLPLMARLIKVANQLARQEGIDKSGYRIAINSGRDGAQAIPHLHIHLLGGRRLSDTLG